MKTHTSNFKNEIKKFGREIDSKITYGTTELGKEQLNSVTPHYESSLLKSVMKQLDIDSNVEIPLETVINYQFGVKVGNQYEYLNYGNYVVYNVEKQEDTKSWKITCYDKMLYAMKDYENLGITYPITVKNYLSAICTKLELTLANDNFINANKEIPSELYLDSEGNSLGYTYRDVLDELSQVVAGIICINNDDELEVRYPNVVGTYATVEGTDLYLENVDDEENFNLELKGNIIQNGTPSPDSAREIETVTGNQEIDIIGKNLFDVDGNVSQGTRVKYGDYGLTFTKNVNRVCRIDLPIVMPSGTYTISMNKVNSTLSGDNKLSIGIMLYASSVQTIQPLVNGTFTTISSFNQLYFFINNDQSDSATITIDNIQLEKGSTATSFESCKANIYEIELDDIELCKIGDYQDKIYKDNGKWYLYKEIGKTLLNGTQNITRRNNGDGSTTLSFNVISDVSILLPGSTYSNRFVYSQSSTDGNEGFGYASGNIYVEIKRNRLSDISTTTKQVESMKEWLSNNNTTFYYILETPITIEITDEELINQLESIRLLTGTNIIMTDYRSPIKITYLSELETIDEEMLKNVNVNFGEIFGPVNSVVLSRSAESDNIYRKDDESIEQNGLTEIKIKDNQILNGNNRDEFIDGIFDKLKGLKYYVNDYVSTGIAYLEVGDFYKVKVEDNSYKCLMLNDELDVTQGLEELIHAERMEDSETNYKNASKTDRTINQAYILVKKNEAEIEELASKVVDVSNTISGIGSITLANAYKGILHRLEISGNISSLMPSNTLTPSATLKPIGIYVVVDEESYLLDLDYLIYNNAEEHDTFVYEDGKCWIERINGTIEEREPVIILVDKNSDISIEPFTDAHLFCEYLLDNKYTSTFANKIEVSSELNLLADTIEAKVSQVADDDGNVTSASIILAVNNDSSSATIDAEKISLQGKEINLTSEDINIKSTNFQVDTNGTMTCNNANINNGVIKTVADNQDIVTIGGTNGIKIQDGDVLPFDINQFAILDAEGMFLYTNDEYFPKASYSMTEMYFQPSPNYLTIRMTADTGNITCVSLTQTSKEERKKNFDKLENALKLINEIDIYKYNYKEENDDDKKHIGVVIGKDYKYSKEITSKNNEEIDIYSFVSVCCKAIQELQQEIEELRKEIK